MSDILNLRNVGNSILGTGGNFILGSGGNLDSRECWKFKFLVIMETKILGSNENSNFRE